MEVTIDSDREYKKRSECDAKWDREVNIRWGVVILQFLNFTDPNKGIKARKVLFRRAPKTKAPQTRSSHEQIA
jgi:hypothetical protein